MYFYLFIYFLSTESLLLRKRRDAPVCLASFHTVASRVGMKDKQNRKKTIARGGIRASHCMGGTNWKEGRKHAGRPHTSVHKHVHGKGTGQLLQITQDGSREARVQWVHAFLRGKDGLADTRAGQRL